MAVKLPKISDLHCPKFKVKIKKRYYRTLLVGGGVAIFLVHYYAPEHEVHAVVVVNTLFALDPTA